MKVRRLVARFDRIKIGITNDPDRRFAQHQEYDEMKVLIRLSSGARARNVERSLVDQFWDHLDNLRRGGGGPIVDDDTCYVYAVVAKK